jgi:hypothetical protein
MIVIRADTHKSTHAFAVVDANTGQLRGEREIPAKDLGYLEALRWAHELDEAIVWAIEDCRKSRIEAMRCLKRYLARHYHRLLLRSPAAFAEHHPAATTRVLAQHPR